MPLSRNSGCKGTTFPAYTRMYSITIYSFLTIRQTLELLPYDNYALEERQLSEISSLLIQNSSLIFQNSRLPSTQYSTISFIFCKKERILKIYLYLCTHDCEEERTVGTDTGF